MTSWTSEHPRLVARVDARGLPVFCEKPVAVDADTAAGMVAAVEAAGVANHVGLVLRAAPAFLHARQLLADPDAGRVLAVVFRDDQYIPNRHLGARRASRVDRAFWGIVTWVAYPCPLFGSRGVASQREGCRRSRCGWCAPTRRCGSPC